MGPIQLRAVQDMEALTRHYNEFVDAMNELIVGGVFTPEQRTRLAVVLARLNMAADQLHLVRQSLKDMGFFEKLTHDDIVDYLTAEKRLPKN